MGQVQDTCTHTGHVQLYHIHTSCDKHTYITHIIHTYTHHMAHTHTHIIHQSPARDDDGFLPVPVGVISHDLGVEGDILRGELRELIRLRVDPTQGLHILGRTCYHGNQDEDQP